MLVRELSFRESQLCELCLNYLNVKDLLLIIIRDYIDSAQPVGSKRIVEYYHLNLSSATIRNEMSALTELGYLRQPHTSAGRVPPKKGIGSLSAR